MVPPPWREQGTSRSTKLFIGTRNHNRSYSVVQTERAMPKTSILAVATLFFLTSEASAVSQAVKNACANDYMDHCATHRVDTDGLRQCMRKAGAKLSKVCINALVASGEVSKGEVVARKKALLAKP